MTALVAGLLVALFYQVPEGVLIAVAGLGLLGVKEPKSKILAVGALYGLCIPLVRAMGIPIGIHTFALMAPFVAIASKITGVKARYCVAAYVIPTFLLSVGEQLLLFPALAALNIDVSSIFARPLYHILAGWLGATPLLVVAALTWYTRLVLLPIPLPQRSPKVNDRRETG